MTTNTLPEPRIARVNQDVDFESFHMIGEHKVRVSIRAYEFQSHARIHVWAPATLEWRLVHALAYSLMQTPASLYVQRGELSPMLFYRDRDTLLAAARAILL